MSTNRKLTTFGRIIRTGMLNFVRNLWLAVAAMAIMIITLTIILFSVIVNATFGHTIDQIAKQVNVSVFLGDTVTEAQSQQLVTALKGRADVKRVEFLDKQQANQNFIKDNANNETLQSAVITTGNPIPATIHVYPRSLNDINAIGTFLGTADNKKLQTSGSPSYSGDRKKAIDNITHATNILRRAGVVAVAVFAAISVLIIFNTLQMAIFNRRDELQIMRLLGASTSYIRGPFVIETIIYGVLSAIASILIVNALFITASSSLQATSFGLLDIAYSQQFFESHYWQLLTIQLTLGILIGAASSTIATRRYLKFKTPKK